MLKFCPESQKAGKPESCKKIKWPLLLWNFPLYCVKCFTKQAGSSHAWLRKSRRQKLVCYSVIGWKKNRLLKFCPEVRTLEGRKAGKKLNGLSFSEFSHFTVYNVSPSKLDSSHAWLRKAEGRKLANCVVVGVVSLTQIYWLFFRHFCAELYFKV